MHSSEIKQACANGTDSFIEFTHRSRRKRNTIHPLLLPGVIIAFVVIFSACLVAEGIERL